MTTMAGISKCLMCGGEFIKRRKDMKFCSKQCRKKYYRRLPGAMREQTEESVAQMWHKFKQSESYQLLISQKKDNRALLTCEKCIWGVNGVCIMPQCTRGKADGHGTENT